MQICSCVNPAVKESDNCPKRSKYCTLCGHWWDPKCGSAHPNPRMPPTKGEINRESVAGAYRELFPQHRIPDELRGSTVSHNKREAAKAKRKKMKKHRKRGR